MTAMLIIGILKFLIELLLKLTPEERMVTIHTLSESICLRCGSDKGLKCGCKVVHAI